GPERGHAADGHRFLPDVEVAEAADLAQAVRFARLLLEAADEGHLPEPPAVLLGTRGVEAPAAGAGLGRGGAGHQRGSVAGDPPAATACSHAWYDDRVSGLDCTR